MKNKFNEEDKKKVIEFLNFLAKKAELNHLSFEDSITWFKLLSHMQTEILPKIDANILEIKRVIESKEEIPELPKE